MTILSAGPSLISGRRRRLERELQALRLMSRNLWVIELSLAFLAVPVSIALSAMIMHAQGWQAGSIGFVTSSCFAIYAAFWWVGRRRRLPGPLLAWIAWPLACILFKTIDAPAFSPFSKEPKKEPGRAKLRRAITKRIAMLNAFGVAHP